MSKLLQYHEQNALGRDWVVGDIHGHFSRLRRALEVIGFDERKDRLFSVGDLVDRGPESNDVLNWLALPWFKPVLGNHDEMAVQWGDPRLPKDMGLYRVNGGAWNIENSNEESIRIADALSALPLVIEVQTQAGVVGIVHANCPYNNWAEFINALSAEDGHEALKNLVTWDRSRLKAGLNDQIAGIRAVVAGHTPILQPSVLGNVHFIDTGGWLKKGGGFTFLDVSTLRTVTVENTPFAVDEI